MTPLRVNLRQLAQKAIGLRGAVSEADLGLTDVDELIRVSQPVRYELNAQLVERGVLITGRVWLTLECECCRCLRPFRLPLDFKDWALHLALEGPERVEAHDDCVDLTPFLREDILLAFPPHPLCDPGCAGLPHSSGGSVDPAGAARQTTEVASAWAVLNKLKL